MPDLPHRIQRRREKGWRMPANAVYVGRPGPFGNRWKVEMVDGVGWCVTDTQAGLTPFVPARGRQGWWTWSPPDA